MAAPHLTFASLLQRTLALAPSALPQSAAWLIVLTAAGVAADLNAHREDFFALLNLAIGCAGMVMPYAITRAVLRPILPPDQPIPSFGRYFLLSLATGLSIMLGLVLLILPGIYLAVRWSASAAAMLARDLDVGESMSASWRLTREYQWTILLFIVTLWLPFIAVVAVTASIDPYVVSPASAILSNLVINLALLAGVHAGVAIYLAADGGAEIAEIFA
jgi:hypothetical protein